MERVEAGAGFATQCTTTVVDLAANSELEVPAISVASVLMIDAICRLLLGLPKMVKMTMVQDKARLKALLGDKVDWCLSRSRELWSSKGTQVYSKVAKAKRLRER